jgi:hypothetical protein
MAEQLRFSINSGALIDAYIRALRMARDDLFEVDGHAKQRAIGILAVLRRVCPIFNFYDLERTVSGWRARIETEQSPAAGLEEALATVESALYGKLHEWYDFGGKPLGDEFENPHDKEQE